jgi:hypothetical protein
MVPMTTNRMKFLSCEGRKPCADEPQFRLLGM